MTTLSGLSGALHNGLPPHPWDSQAEQYISFPGNTAVGVAEFLGGGVESGSHQGYIWSFQERSRPPTPEGVYTEFLAQTHALWQDSRKKLMDEVRALQASYAFRNEPAITLFCSTHIAAAAFLSTAAVELKRSFGDDAVLYLEGLVEDDDSPSLYAIVAWRGDAESAEAALEDFDERWSFNQRAQPGLTFTYELV
jgi:hypothetical protein